MTAHDILKRLVAVQKHLLLAKAHSTQDPVLQEITLATKELYALADKLAPDVRENK